MAKIVSAVALTHNPRIFWNADAAEPEDRQWVYDTFAKVSAALQESRPDSVILLANDHFDNFFLDNMPQFCVGLAETASGPFWYEQEIQKLPSYTATIDRRLGEYILRKGVDAGIDLGYAHEFKFDHAFTVPLHFLLPNRNVPIVPIYTNVFAYPIASTQRFYDVGRALREVIAARPTNERIAVIASFNMSVEVGGPKVGQRDIAFDDRAVELMQHGAIEEVLREFPVERLIQAGNSTTEFLNYVAALGIIGNRKPEMLEFKIVKGWGNCPSAFWSLE